MTIEQRREFDNLGIKNVADLLNIKPRTKNQSSDLTLEMPNMPP